MSSCIFREGWALLTCSGRAPPQGTEVPRSTGDSDIITTSTVNNDPSGLPRNPHGNPHGDPPGGGPGPHGPAAKSLLAGAIIAILLTIGILFTAFVCWKRKERKQRTLFFKEKMVKQRGFLTLSWRRSRSRLDEEDFDEKAGRRGKGKRGSHATSKRASTSYSVGSTSPDLDLDSESGTLSVRDSQYSGHSSIQSGTSTWTDESVPHIATARVLSISSAGSGNLPSIVVVPPSLKSERSTH